MFVIGIILIVSSIAMYSSRENAKNLVLSEELSASNLQGNSNNNVSINSEYEQSNNSYDNSDIQDDNGDECFDSDGGKNTNARGVVQGKFQDEAYINRDICLDTTTVIEQYCVGTRSVTVNIKCADNKKCVNGLCKILTDVSSNCGDEIVESDEICDGNDLNVTCMDLGFDYGNLSCNENCSSYNTTQCHDYEAICGNDIREGNESCDGSDLNLKTCISSGFDSGVLVCKSDCTYDYSYCTTSVVSKTCGNNILENNEECDGNLIPKRCSELGFNTGTIGCTNDCKYDTHDCIKIENTCIDSDNGINFITKGYTYGENDGNFFNYSDSCDGNIIIERYCSNESQVVLTNFSCTLNNSVCYSGRCIKETELCGNYKIELNEDCDKNNLNNQTCATLDFDVGTLKCSSSCKFDKTGCYTNECSSANDCNDYDVSTMDFCTGVPKSCIHTKITECNDYDNYCPTNCTFANDSDC